MIAASALYRFVDSLTGSLRVAAPHSQLLQNHRGHPWLTAYDSPRRIQSELEPLSNRTLQSGPNKKPAENELGGLGTDKLSVSR